MPVQALIADDLATIRRLVVHGLERNFTDIIVEEAKNGKEAQEKIAKNRYDFVICDWELPVTNGEELLKWIQSQPDFDRTPFIMLVSRDGKECIMSAMNAGASSYLVKPFTTANLIQNISTVVGKLKRRESEYPETEGPVTMRFGSHSMTGELIDVGLGGLLSYFKKDDALPAILDKVTLTFDLGYDIVFADIEGFILRIQAAEARIDSEYIKYAIKFVNVDTKTEERLLEYLRKTYPRQW